MEDISKWDLNPAWDSVTADPPVSTDITLCGECADEAKDGDGLRWDAVTVEEGIAYSALCDHCADKAAYTATAYSY